MRDLDARVMQLGVPIQCQSTVMSSCKVIRF